MNNVNLESVHKFVEDAKATASVLKKGKKIEGEWNLNNEKEPQFQALIEYKEGKIILNCDQPPFMGGKGLAPDPLQYCLYGLAACFAGTFVTTATEQGVKLGDFKISAENQVDLGRAIGLTNNPIVEKVRIIVKVKSNADIEKLREIEEITRKRCPGVYCLTNPIPLETEVECAPQD